MTHLCSWNLSVYMNTYSYRLHLCSWSHTVHKHILFGHDCWARCHEDTPCAWSHIIIAVDHIYVQHLRDVIGHITLEECFNLKHCYFIKWHHCFHRPKQCSSFVTNFMEQDYWTRLLAKSIVIFYIWCCYSIVAYVHLRLRLQLQHLHPSAYNYIDYSSAVDLVALRFEQCPICCKFSCVACKFSM